MMTIAPGAARTPSTNSTRLSCTTDSTAGRQITGAVNSARFASGAGETAGNGGTNTNIAGVVTV
ncbi:MAG TPA: hypothetical protein VKL40_10110, partial [Candidatus Angelobacter sp.]|nr:hypothetical protein [Candidatus Angelobacter sp.]